MKQNYLPGISMWLAVIVLDTVVFSPGFLGWSLENPAALPVIMITLVLLAGGALLLLPPRGKKVHVYKANELLDIDQMKKVLEEMGELKGIPLRQASEIRSCLEHLEEKKDGLNRMLAVRFGGSPLTRERFWSSVEDAELYILCRLRACINRLNLVGGSWQGGLRKEEVLSQALQDNEADLARVQQALEDLECLQLEIINSQGQSSGPQEEVLEELNDKIESLKHYV